MLDASTIPHQIIISVLLLINNTVGIGMLSSRPGRLLRIVGQQVSAQLASSKQYCAKGNRVESIAAQIVGEPG